MITDCGMSNVKNGGKRPSCKRILKNALVTVGILAAAAALSLVVERLLEIREYSAAIFVFAVFLISLWTDGYAWAPPQLPHRPYSHRTAQWQFPTDTMKQQRRTAPKWEASW